MGGIILEIATAFYLTSIFGSRCFTDGAELWCYSGKRNNKGLLRNVEKENSILKIYFYRIETCTVLVFGHFIEYAVTVQGGGRMNA